jgi:N-acetyl-gamma-glutamyl-phosphate reductase
MVTCVVRSRGADVRELLEASYRDSHIVDVLPKGVAPELARVQHTDGAEIGVFEDRLTGDAIVVCALDNLGKGAAGQAVQNANCLFGWDETMGLRLSGVLV